MMPYQEFEEDELQKMSRDGIRDYLRSGTWEVKFLKVDGSERVMKCTLQEGVYEPPKGSNKTPSDEVIPVWDCEKEAWRSFRVDSMISMKEVDC